MSREEMIEKLKTSVEVSTIRKWMLVYVILLPVICLAHYWKMRNELFVISPLILYSAVGLSALVPLLGYQIWLLWRIFREPESYRFYRVILTEIHGKRKNHAYYFTVELEVPGGIRRVNTRPIFQTWGPVNPRVKDYINYRVIIAYNEVTGQVVVIG